MAGAPPSRAIAWLVGLLTLVVAAAVAVYLMLPRSGLSPAPHDWSTEWRAEPPVVEALPGESGWARFDKYEQLEALRRSLSADLEERARDTRRVALAREASRRTIGEFVEKWLLGKDPAWTPGAFTAVKVYFPDEMDEGLSTELGVRR